MNLTRWRIADKFRARRPEDHHAQDGQDEDAGVDPPDIEYLTDPQADDEVAWENEWQHSVLEAALARLARRVAAKQFQAFDLYIRQRWPVLRISRELGINPAAVYLISHRLTKQLKIEVAHLKAQLG
jgi:hypothetical protein